MEDIKDILGDKTIDVADLRCTSCEKLLAKHGKLHDTIQIKCSRCGTLNMFFENAKEQIVITNPEGIILFANNIVTEISGYSIAEVIGSTPALWGKQMPKEFYAAMWRDIKVYKKSIATEVVNKRKDGTKYRAKLRISPVLDNAGEVNFYVGIESLIKEN